MKPQHTQCYRCGAEFINYGGDEDDICGLCPICEHVVEGVSPPDYEDEGCCPSCFKSTDATGGSLCEECMADPNIHPYPNKTYEEDRLVDVMAPFMWDTVRRLSYCSTNMRVAWEEEFELDDLACVDKDHHAYKLAKKLRCVLDDADGCVYQCQALMKNLIKHSLKVRKCVWEHKARNPKLE